MVAALDAAESSRGTSPPWMAAAPIGAAIALAVAGAGAFVWRARRRERPGA